jgi:GWxTD domain-containing protein
MKLFIYILLLLLFQTVSAQVENVYNNSQGSPNAKYFQDFLNFASDQEGKSRVDIFIQVPYTEIQFVKTTKGFSAAYTSTISVYDEDKENLLVEKSWKEKIDAIDFEQTVSKNNYNLSMRSFYLTPGKYFLVTSVEDEDSRKKYTSENSYTIRDFSNGISISDIMLVSKQTQAEGNNKLVPNVSRNITSKRDGIPMFFEIYSDTAANVNLEFTIKDEEENIVHKDTLAKHLDTGRTQVIYTIKDIALGLGNYVVTVNIIDSINEELSQISKSFVSRWIGIPKTIQDLDKAVSQLIYIATPSEIGYIEDSEEQNEKIDRYLDFWKKKDPTPNTEENEIFNEYYRRISYANENFSHYVEGWRSDRGMVFIILGSPNNVDRHPFDLESKPYEVWQYYELNRSFVFIDQTGFGDYRLVTPLYGDDFRYRN